MTGVMAYILYKRLFDYLVMNRLHLSRIALATCGWSSNLLSYLFVNDSHF